MESPERDRLEIRNNVTIFMGDAHSGAGRDREGKQAFRWEEQGVVLRMGRRAGRTKFLSFSPQSVEMKMR